MVVSDQVLDLTHVLSQLPCGEKTLLTFAGKDATDEFFSIHRVDAIEKLAPDAVIGTMRRGK